MASLSAGRVRFWVVEEKILTALLRRAHEGEDPGLLMVELQANSRSEEVGGE